VFLPLSIPKKIANIVEYKAYKHENITPILIRGYKSFHIEKKIFTIKLTSKHNCIE
jgi:hypothetical protein